MINNVDHIVIAVSDLDKGMDWLEKKLGIRPVYGGQHITEGTHNALLNLGNSCYLELLAIDSSNKKINPPRWMGVDLIEAPTITRWAVKSNNIEQEVSFLKNVNPLLGNIKSGMRAKQDGSILKWQLSIPLPEPMVEVTPFLIDWGESVHPTTSLEPACKLVSMVLKHPYHTEIQEVMENINLDFKLEKGEQPSISIVVDSPNGLIKL